MYKKVDIICCCHKRKGGKMSQFFFLTTCKTINALFFSFCKLLEFFKRISFSPSQNISMTDFCLIDTFLTFWTQSVSPRTLCENSKKIMINLLCQSSPYFVKSILEIPLQKAIFFKISYFHGAPLASEFLHFAF